MTIPNSVTLVNQTNQEQLFEFGYKIPPSPTPGAGTLTIDMTALTCYRREKLWAAIQFAILGSVISLAP